MDFLKRWWTIKYGLPSNHDLFLKEPPVYWLKEYYIDYFEKNPLDVHRNESGDVQFTDTGDSLIDKWEQIIAEGGEPDLIEAFTPEAWERLQNRRGGSSGLPGLVKHQATSIADTVSRFHKESQAKSGKIQEEPIPPLFGRYSGDE